MDRYPILPRILTIPSDDTPFREHVDRVRRESKTRRPEELEVRLRRLFPRVVVRERGLSGESPSWYVYRDGSWRSSMSGPWWEASGLPRVFVSSEGWITDANPTARSLLGIEASEVGFVHLTDFVAPGTLDDAVALFGSIDAGQDLTATVLLRPTSGDIVAIDLRASRLGSETIGVFRLAEDVAFAPTGVSVRAPDREARPRRSASWPGHQTP